MRPWIFRLIGVSTLLLALLGWGQAAAQLPGSARDIIKTCWHRGAINEFLMFQCSGLSVPPPAFHACMNGGPCLGEPPLAVAHGGGPLCGAAGLPFCPAPSPCGFLETIGCPPPPGITLPPFPVAPACGAMGFPPCNQPQTCGHPNTVPCAPPPPAPAGGRGIPFGTWQPTLQVALPGSAQPQPGAFSGGVRFAATPLPNLNALRNCYDSASDEDEFHGCLVDKALPPAYRLTKECLRRHDDDAAAAFVCSTGNRELQHRYEQVREVQECAQDASNNAEVANCLGQPFLGQNERYYANCLARNANDLSAAVVCGLAKDLTPEQQIALSCAVKTGGQPHAFATCAGGQLAAREIDKCWQHGIGTEKGCFGPNNELNKFWNGVDGTLRNTLGPSSDLYRAFSLYKNNVLAPGPNHELVRAANTVLNDLRHGPGPGHDIVRAGNAISGGLQSVGSAVGNALRIKF